MLPPPSPRRPPSLHLLLAPLTGRQSPNKPFYGLCSFGAVKKPCSLTLGLKGCAATSTSNLPQAGRGIAASPARLFPCHAPSDLSSHDRTARQGSGLGRGGNPPSSPSRTPRHSERQKEQTAAQAERSDGNRAARATGCNTAPDKSRPAAEKGKAEAKSSWESHDFWQSRGEPLSSTRAFF